MENENQNTSAKSDASNDPHWIAKTPKGHGRKARLERVGVAWNRPQDGGICIRLLGTQIVSEDIYLFPNETAEQ